MKTLLLVVALLIAQPSFAERETGGVQIGKAVFVNFISFGSGIDAETLKLAQHQIARDIRNDKNLFDYTKEVVGMEGETQLCVHYANPSDVLEFLKAIQPTILADRQARGGMVRTEVLTGDNCESTEKTPVDLANLADQADVDPRAMNQ